MGMLGDRVRGRITNRERLRKFLGQQVMDQKVKEKTATEKNPTLVWTA